MFSLQLFVGEELLDPGALDRGQIQGMLQEYIPLIPLQKVGALVLNQRNLSHVCKV